MSCKVLAINDDHAFLELMEAILSEEGYQVFICDDSRLAYDRARAIKPDAITVDLRMPDRSGWEVLAQIKRDPELADTPIVVISGVGAELAETTDQLRTLGLGDTEILVKPFEIDELLSGLAEAIVMRPGGRKCA
jgi:DNA-binding response OmpR family regulator